MLLPPIPFVLIFYTPSVIARPLYVVGLVVPVIKSRSSSISGHCRNRWREDSVSCVALRTQLSTAGQPLFCRFAAVCRLSCSSSQMKTRILGGTLSFQTVMNNGQRGRYSWVWLCCEYAICGPFPGPSSEVIIVYDHWKEVAVCLSPLERMMVMQLVVWLLGIPWCRYLSRFSLASILVQGAVLGFEVEGPD